MSVRPPKIESEQTSQGPKTPSFKKAEIVRDRWQKKFFNDEFVLYQLSACTESKSVTRSDFLYPKVNRAQVNNNVSNIQ